MRWTGWAQAHGITRGYGSYEEVLDDPEIDAVYIPLPTHLHAQFTILAADKKKHVLYGPPCSPQTGNPSISK